MGLIIVVPDRQFKVLNMLKMFSFSFPIKIYKDSEILLHKTNMTDWKKLNAKSQEDFKESNGEEISNIITSEKCDNDLIGLEYQLGQHEGYAIQMLIKLYISQYVKTPFYLTLDADVLAIGPITFSDLIHEDIGEEPQTEDYIKGFDKI